VVISLNNKEFKEKIFDYTSENEWKFKGSKPSIIKFWAEWCAPCKMLGPVLEEISEEYAGKMNVYKIDTDAEQELAMAFGIQSIPSILFIPMEGKPQMAQGAAPKDKLIEAMKNVMGVE